jgi:4-hydroxy-tetrahydrodipicolinate reductase
MNCLIEQTQTGMSLADPKRLHLKPMKVLLLGSGKTGSLVAQVARERGHDVETLRSADNSHAGGLTKPRLAAADVVIDFTTPHCVLENINACVAAGKNMVVGTTGWYSEREKVRAKVEQHQTSFLYGSNFSIGVNLFFELVRASAPALAHRYGAQIYERHHTTKKDAPSGTAATMQKLLQEASQSEIEITSFREGDVVGMHELVLDSPNDSIYLCHDAKSRRGFAEGAVRAAEWIAGKAGFFEFKDIWRQL